MDPGLPPQSKSNMSILMKIGGREVWSPVWGGTYLVQILLTSLRICVGGEDRRPLCPVLHQWRLRAAIISWYTRWGNRCVGWTMEIMEQGLCSQHGCRKAMAQKHNQSGQMVNYDWTLPDLTFSVDYVCKIVSGMDEDCDIKRYIMISPVYAKH